VKNIDDLEIHPVHQNHMPADEYMRAIGRRRRELAFEFRRARIHSSAQFLRNYAACYEFALQPGWQAVAVSQSRRQVIMMRRIPSTHRIVFAVAVKMVPVVIPVAIPVMIAMEFIPVPIVIAPIVLRKALCAAHSKHGCHKQI
jgi:hypothetical protein